jgi:plastocyanin
VKLRTWALAALAAAAAWPAAAHAAPPLTADYTATDVTATNHQWYVTGTTVTTSTIAAHGVVSFKYPVGTSRHDVIFSTSGPKPTGCTPALTTVAQGAYVPPTGPTARGWGASCSFDAPGTYSFVCQLHPNMRGTIVVSAADSGQAVGGSVPDVLSIGVGPAAGLGQFLLGVARDYTADLPATVTSTMADATLTASDPSATVPGHLLNGNYGLAQALQVKATDSASTAADFAALTSPVTLLNWAGPVSNDNVTVSFKQPIAATDPLRSGQYAKTVVFTLSSSAP